MSASPHARPFRFVTAKGRRSVRWRDRTVEVETEVGVEAPSEGDFLEAERKAIRLVHDELDLWAERARFRERGEVGEPAAHDVERAKRIEQLLRSFVLLVEHHTEPGGGSPTDLFRNGAALLESAHRELDNVAPCREPVIPHDYELAREIRGGGA